MNAKFFLDTNVFVYSFDSSAPQKQKKSQALIEAALESQTGSISWQVVQEFLSVATRKALRFFRPFVVFATVSMTISEVVSALVPAQQAYLKASNTRQNAYFGVSVATSGDTIVAGSYQEASNATGVNGNQSDRSAGGAGAVYIFVRDAFGGWSQQAYLKASNTEAEDYFGISVAVSGDTVVIGAYGEDSDATGVNGNQTNNNAFQAGAAYIFVRNGSTWTQQAYLKASNARQVHRFGQAVSVSGDTVVVGAYLEDSNSTGVNSNQSDTNAPASGAAYVFVRTGTNWSQQAYLKASNTGINDSFGSSAAVSGDTVVVGAFGESSNATGVNGNPNNNSAPAAGAAYVFTRSGTSWTQQAYLKASNAEADDLFGSVAVSGDTVVVGAALESSDARGVNGDPNNNNAFRSGAAYVFARSGTTWSQQAYLKASNTEANDGFGSSVSISSDTVVIGSRRESSNATGVNGDPNNNSAGNSGAAYAFVRSGTNWIEKAYLKASNTGANDNFGWSVSLSDDTVVVGAHQEASNFTGANGNQNDNSMVNAGAAYVFTGLGLGRPITIVPDDNSGGYFIRINGITGFSYQLQRAPSVTGPWTSNATFTALSPGLIEFHDTNSPQGQVFYRTVQHE